MSMYIGGVPDQASNFCFASQRERRTVLAVQRKTPADTIEAAADGGRTQRDLGEKGKMREQSQAQYRIYDNLGLCKTLKSI
ncbi:hypothetical protein LTR85_009022 [Meristemomyces frigidus]|nr:hypothetical protein LTR85_009022 [Meristemomyces frigidus]